MNLGVRWWRVSHGARAAGGSSTHPAVDLADVGEDAHEGLTQPSLPRHLRRTHQQWVHAADRANESTVCAASVRLLRVPMPLEALDEEILCGERPPSTQTETGGASREPQAEGPPWRVRTQRKKGGGKFAQGRCRALGGRAGRQFTLSRSSKIVCWSTPCSYSCSANHLAAAEASAVAGF